MNRFLILCAAMVMLTSMPLTAYPATPRIQLNGSGDPLAVSRGESPLLSIGMAGAGTAPVDWWLLLIDGNGDFRHYDLTTREWSKGLTPTHSGPLVSFDTVVLSTVTGLLEGSYLLAFGVDDIPNGTLDGNLSYDTAELTVTPALDGPPEPALLVDIFDETKAYSGKTLFATVFDDGPKVFEIDMAGTITWTYDIPKEFAAYTNPGMDTERLPGDNVLIVLPRHGFMEVDRSGNTVRLHEDPGISHDADRLSNGNTLYAFGANDPPDVAVVKEIDPEGNIVWVWNPFSHYGREPYLGISDEGWAHTNAVTRASNGNTLVSLRNFNLTVEVDGNGNVVWEYDWTRLGGDHPDPHEPELNEADNTLLVCLQNDSPHIAAMIGRDSREPVWTYENSSIRTSRDCDRLPNGNILIVGVLKESGESVMIEVTVQGEIVWRLKLINYPAGNSPGYFYKAERY